MVGYKPGPGRDSLLDFKRRMRMREYGPKSDLEYRADEIPQCHALKAAHRTKHS